MVYGGVPPETVTVIVPVSSPSHTIPVLTEEQITLHALSTSKVAEQEFLQLVSLSVNVQVTVTLAVAPGIGFLGPSPLSDFTVPASYA